MTNEEILKKAIVKAEKNGYSPIKHYLGDYFDEWFNKGEGRHNQEFTMIFSHDFAKAFWGEGTDIKYQVDGDIHRGWRHHQHKMLDEIQEEANPLKYLEKFL